MTQYRPFAVASREDPRMTAPNTFSDVANRMPPYHLRPARLAASPCTGHCRAAVPRQQNGLVGACADRHQGRIPVFFSGKYRADRSGVRRSASGSGGRPHDSGGVCALTRRGSYTLPEFPKPRIRLTRFSQFGASSRSPRVHELGCSQYGGEIDVVPSRGEVDFAVKPSAAIRHTGSRGSNMESCDRILEVQSVN